MVGIKRISDATQCPSRLLHLLEKNPQSLKSSGQQNRDRRKDNFSKMTQGIIFECSIQYLMVYEFNIAEQRFEKLMDWYDNKISFPSANLDKESIIWPEGWIENELVYEQNLGRKIWNHLADAAENWYQTQKPWVDDIEWKREHSIGGKISLDKYTIDVSGRIDLYGKDRENRIFIIELKDTDRNSIDLAKYQASLYIKTLQYKSKDIVEGYVYHSTEGMIDPFEDADWEKIISLNQDPETAYNPTVFVCRKCPKYDCHKRIIDTRKI